MARDGYRGLALLRKPPGSGPFPVVVVIHGGPQSEVSVTDVVATVEYVQELP